MSNRYFYFTRHGQTIWNVENKICGATDIALTDLDTSRRSIWEARSRRKTWESMRSFILP